ncbi:maltose ABC transporter substrate-binding protein [Caloramator sp. mosi_1]|uniref:sugar ABC transporter substrate-binding protein n=1 Tax=Caloramator sp. mosi_1 TaxID=3023090 RepID=UPI00235F5C7B|nr:maltose ABC transporter substrate-binding protein [Caloramator sp. mosi_1]WDC85226.1 maltose ABC transporter substrate-binding protein [Caloramator sp. mosi_1]
MKRPLALILSGLLVVSLLAGCGKKPAENNNNNNNNNTANELKPEDGAKLVVWESEGPEGEYIKYVAAEFEKKYGVPVKYEPVDHTATSGKLQQDGPAGVGADIISAPHDHVGKMVAAGLIQPNHKPDRIKNDYVQAAIDGVSMNGTVYGYPTAIETYALFYNKDIIKEAPKTYEEIIEFAKTFNNPKEKKFALAWDVGNAYFSYSFLTANGGYVFGKAGTDKDDIGLNNDGAVAGATFYKSLTSILPLKAADANYQFMDGSFAAGKVAMIINGPWAVKGYTDAKVNFGVAPLPTFNGKQPKSFSGIRGLYISAFTKYPKAAQLFLEFATSDEMLMKRYEMTHQIPPVKALMDKPEVSGDPIVAGFIAQIKNAEPMPSIPQMQLVWEPLATSFSAIWDGQMEPKASLDKCVQTVKDAIAAQK